MRQNEPRFVLNRFEVQVSQSRIDVFGADFSTDNGQTFSNNKLLYSANISLPFTRGYVHFNPRNHASVKYGFGPDVIFHWDNIEYDGPVIAAPRAYEIPDNTVVTSHNGSQVQNLGYQLYDGTTGKADNRDSAPGCHCVKSQRYCPGSSKLWRSNHRPVESDVVPVENYVGAKPIFDRSRDFWD